jgi:hypothetical protein
VSKGLLPCSGLSRLSFDRTESQVEVSCELIHDCVTRVPFATGGGFLLAVVQLICYSTSPMFISGLIFLSVFWHLVRSVPGLFESLGYLFGILVGSFTINACIERDSNS